MSSAPGEAGGGAPVSTEASCSDQGSKLSTAARHLDGLEPLFDVPPSPIRPVTDTALRCPDPPSGKPVITSQLSQLLGVCGLRLRSCPSSWPFAGRGSHTVRCSPAPSAQLQTNPKHHHPSYKVS